MTILRRLGITLTLLAAALCGSLVLGELHASYAPPDQYGVCNGRLTLTSGVPITTDDVTAATSVKFTPVNGNRCPAYVSGQWMPRTFAELSIAVPATTNTLYDVFLYDNAGTLALELSAAWNSDTARFGAGTYATLLPTQDGVYVKSTNGTAIDATRRYLGTLRTTAVSGQTEDSYAKRFVWNYYNRAPRAMRIADATVSWNYTTGTIRQARASTANQLALVVGVAQDEIHIEHSGQASNTGGGVFASFFIGEDSTTTPATGSRGADAWVQAAGEYSMGVAYFDGPPAVGYHFYTMLERSTATGTTTFYGAGQSTGNTTVMSAAWKS